MGKSIRDDNRVTALIGQSTLSATTPLPMKINPATDGMLVDSNITSGLAIPAHDYIGLTYTGDNITTVVYKTGGSGGATVATLTIAYSGSNITSVTKT